MFLINMDYYEGKISLNERNKLLIEANDKLPFITDDEYWRLKNTEVSDCTMYINKYYTPLGNWCEYCMGHDPRLKKNCLLCNAYLKDNPNYKGINMLCRQCFKKSKKSKKSFIT